MSQRGLFKTLASFALLLSNQVALGALNDASVDAADSGSGLRGRGLLDQTTPQEASTTGGGLSNGDSSKGARRNLATLTGLAVAGVSSGALTSPLANANFLDTNIDPSNWQNHPQDAVVAPATAYIDVDLGKQTEIDAVTIWHYWLDTRKYKNQKLEVSRTGAFNGEQIEIYNVALGPVETSSGNTITLSSSVVGRYIRHTCGGSTQNNGVHFIGLEVDGEEVGDVAVQQSANDETCLRINSEDVINLEGTPVFVDTDASGPFPPTTGDMSIAAAPSGRYVPKSALPIETGLYKILQIDYQAVCTILAFPAAPACNVEFNLQVCTRLDCSRGNVYAGKFTATGTGPEPYVITGGTKSFKHASGIVDGEFAQGTGNKLEYNNAKIDICFPN